MLRRDNVVLWTVEGVQVDFAVGEVVMWKGEKAEVQRGDFMVGVQFACKVNICGEHVQTHARTRRVNIFCMCFNFHKRSG